MIASFAAAGLLLAGVSVHMEPGETVPGGVVWITVRGLPAQEVPELRVGDRIVPLHREGETGTALVGFPLDQPLAPVELELTAGEVTATAQIRLRDGKYPEEKLTLPAEKVSGFSEATQARIEREWTEWDAVWKAASLTRLWSGAWRWPVEGSVRSAFGKRRVINGEPRSPHSGIDQRGGVGTPVHAVNAGTVVYAGEQFFAGNAVILDHGHGLYSMYFHLSRILVEVDQEVAGGALVGKVGATGRVSGPHLHWGMRLLTARIDPQRFLKLMDKLGPVESELTGSAR